MHARPDNRARVIHYLQSVIPGTFAFTSFKQTHSSSIAHIDSTNAGAYIEDYDGGITALRNHIVGVNFADCTPVLLFDPATHICGAVHAGWRGVYNNILSVAVKKMNQKSLLK
jgi:copper oxidase (laccase) domain-containing protein